MADEPRTANVDVSGTTRPATAASVARSTIREPTNFRVVAVLAVALRCAAPVDARCIIERAAATSRRTSRSKSEDTREQDDRDKEFHGEDVAIF